MDLCTKNDGEQAGRSMVGEFVFLFGFVPAWQRIGNGWVGQDWSYFPRWDWKNRRGFNFLLWNIEMEVPGI